MTKTTRINWKPEVMRWRGDKDIILRYFFEIYGNKTDDTGDGDKCWEIKPGDYIVQPDHWQQMKFSRKVTIFKDEDGYLRYVIDGGYMKGSTGTVRNAAYRLFVDSRIDGRRQIRHKCSNPRCWRRGHLELVPTKKDQRANSKAGRKLVGELCATSPEQQAQMSLPF